MLKCHNINFGAKFITQTNIKKFDNEKKIFSPEKISFVEIEPNERNDLKALANITKFWADKDSYASTIALTAISIAAGYTSKNTHKIFALTKQNNNFDKINDRDILCIGEVEVTDNISPIRLNYLQVHPKNVYSTAPLYKYIGTSFLNMIKQLYNTSIILDADSSAVKFYEKNGFKRFSLDKLIYIWRPKIKM